MTDRIAYQKEHRHALGTEATIFIVAAPAVAAPIFEVVWQTLSDFEARFSRFKEGSELSKFNARAGEWYKVSPEFYQMLKLCKHFGSLTKGLFNPFILPTLQKVGYTGSWPAVNDFDTRLDVRNRTVVNIEELLLQDEQAYIPTSTALDFGGIGKGYALDVLGAVLDKYELAGYCISLGGDVLCKGYTLTDAPWRVGIEAANDTTQKVGVLVNEDAALFAAATSTTVKRRGQGWHHIINPLTNEPASSNVESATVMATSGVQADIFAKLFIIDPAAAEQIVAPLAGVGYHGAILQLTDGTIKQRATAQAYAQLFVTPTQTK